MTENYNLNDSIKVSGLAKAFLEAPFQIPSNLFYFRELQPNWKNGYYGGNSQIIKTGNTTTNGKGVFEIDFIAVPDSLTKKQRSLYSYIQLKRMLPIQWRNQKCFKNHQTWFS